MRHLMIKHNVKLWVLGMGLLFSPDIFEFFHGIPPQKDGAMAFAVLGGMIALMLSLLGSFYGSGSKAQ